MAKSHSKPDYRIGALNKKTDEKNPRVGAAWTNPDGSISVVINDFVVIHGGKDVLLTLFPQTNGDAG